VQIPEWAIADHSLPPNLIHTLIVISLCPTVTVQGLAWRR